MELNIKKIEELANNSIALIIKLSCINEYSMTATIYDPRIMIEDGVVIISRNDDDTDENEIQIEIGGFKYNEYNSNENRLVFNNNGNFVNSLSIQGVS